MFEPFTFTGWASAHPCSAIQYNVDGSHEAAAENAVLMPSGPA